MSVRIRKGNFRLTWTAETVRRTLTPSQFAPDSDNKRPATFGWQCVVVIDRSSHRPFNLSLFTPGGLPPSSLLMIYTKRDLLSAYMSHRHEALT